MSEAQTLRDAILAAPLETSSFGEEPQPGTLYVPLSHLKALRLDANVVVGGRGVGKSFWTAALQSESLRKLLGSSAPELNGVEVRVGFANKPAIERYTNDDVFERFIACVTMTQARTQLPIGEARASQRQYEAELRHQTRKAIGVHWRSLADPSSRQSISATLFTWA